MARLEPELWIADYAGQFMPVLPEREEEVSDYLDHLF
jgi:hypothetical protein